MLRGMDTTSKQPEEPAEDIDVTAASDASESSAASHDPTTADATAHTTRATAANGIRRTPRQVARGLIEIDHPHMDVADVAASGDPVPIDLRDYVVFKTQHATRVRTVAGDHLALDLWCVEPQQSTGVLQYAEHDVIYTVLGGRCWFVTERGDVGLDPLGALLVPAGTVHGIDNRGADPLILSMAMAPPDDEDVSAPTGPGLAIRDDAKYGRRGRKARATFERLIGR